MIVSCKQCHCDFHATKHRRVFCCRKCKDTHDTKIDAEKLAWFAFQGRTGKDIADQFGVSTPRVTRVLRTHGLYQLWRSQRYA